MHKARINCAEQFGIALRQFDTWRPVRMGLKEKKAFNYLSVQIQRAHMTVPRDNRAIVVIRTS